MAEVKSRKSVSFDPDTTVVDGNTTESEPLNNDGKTTAEGHSADPAVDDLTASFSELAKKKKKPKAAKKEGDDADGEKTEVAGDELADLQLLKKKKKKKAAPKEDFDAKLAEAGEGAEATSKPEEEAASQEGDMIEGTGIWEHDREDKIAYPNLLDRFFIQLHDRHPDLSGAGLKSTKIPPPQCLREGNKKTIFANLPDIAKRLKRHEDHVTQFLFAELGTSGSVDASRRLVIKGRFQSKQIENILRRYIQDYVSCKTCRSLNTELAKGENRLWYITCQSCGSRRTVPAINRGFHALVGKRKRQQA